MKLQNLINEKLSIVLFLTVFFSVSLIVRAAPGDLDLSFSPSIAGDNLALVKTIAVQPDGKILIGGDFYSVNGLPRYGLARLHPDGSLDTTF